MITCECGCEFPYPDLREVFCRDGLYEGGYYQIPLLGPVALAPRLCPCSCHAEAQEQPAVLEADAARMDPAGWVAASAEQLAEAETAQQALRLEEKKA